MATPYGMQPPRELSVSPGELRKHGELQKRWRCDYRQWPIISRRWDRLAGPNDQERAYPFSSLDSRTCFL